MLVLTNKELLALSDRLSQEKALHCKYRAAARECEDDGLKVCFEGLANQHKQNFNTLMGYLH